jgi:hypothetical protein
MPLYIAFLAYDAFINTNPEDNPPPGPNSRTTTATALRPAPGHTDASIRADEERLFDIATSILSRWYSSDDDGVSVRLFNFVREMYVSGTFFP